MKKNESLPFECLRKLLRDLGFVETLVPGPYWLFEHAPTATLLPYRDYRPGDSVSWADLVMTRRLLDERGILADSEFEALVDKAPV